MPKRNNREPAQPTTRSKRQPRHHHGTVAANPQAQSAPIPIDPVAPAQTTTSLLSSEQLQQVSQAMADILGQNRTQPMPIEPLQPGMGTQPMPIESLQPSMAGHDQCTVDVCDFLADMKKLKDFTTCRQCKQGFDNDAHKPYLLPCLDAICESCIKAISYMKDVSEKQGLTCNECHCTHTCFQNGQLSLQVDSTRRIASEILCQINGNSSLVCEMCTNNEKVLHRCIDCYLFICAECAILHSTIKPLKSHTLLEIKGLLTDDKNYLSLFRSAFYCPVNMHEKELLKMYCLNSSCMKPVCGMCCITTHKDHVFYNIAEAGNDKKTKIRDLIANVSLKENQAQKYVVELQNINDKYVQDPQQLQNEIKTLFGEAKNALDVDDVAAILNDKQECIEKERQKLAVFLTSCKHASYYLHISPRINDQHSFIDIAKSIQLQLKNLKSQEIWKSNQHGYNEIRRQPFICLFHNINLQLWKNIIYKGYCKGV